MGRVRGSRARNDGEARGGAALEDGGGGGCAAEPGTERRCKVAAGPRTERGAEVRGGGSAPKREGVCSVCS